MKKLSFGKIPIDVLARTVLKTPGRPSDDIITGPRAGVDFSVLKRGSGYVIVSADPITGVTKNIGSYAIKVSANDVATSGNRPMFAEIIILLPEGATEARLSRVSREIDETASRLGISILGGHTEVTPGLSRPIVMVTVFSFVKSFVTSADANEGDVILMTKTAGLEGASELAREYPFPPRSIPARVLREARRLIDEVGIVEEAVAAFGTGKVHAMHDCTEGGILGAVFEMSLASGLGFRLWEEAVPVSPQAKAICKRLSIDPLKLIGSGSLLIAVSKDNEATVARKLSKLTRVTSIGEFRIGKRSVVHGDGSETNLSEAPVDELWRVLSRPGRSRYGA